MDLFLSKIKIRSNSVAPAPSSENPSSSTDPSSSSTDPSSSTGPSSTAGPSFEVPGHSGQEDKSEIIADQGAMKLVPLQEEEAGDEEIREEVEEVEEGDEEIREEEVEEEIREEVERIREEVETSSDELFITKQGSTEAPEELIEVVTVTGSAAAQKKPSKKTSRHLLPPRKRYPIIPTISQRRKVRDAERMNTQQLRATLSKQKSAGYAFEFVSGINRAWKRCEEIKGNIVIWDSSIKEIEGKLGSGVSTYFKVLVWLLKINVLCLVLSLAFIVGPALWIYDTRGGENSTTYNKDDLECTNPDFVSWDSTSGDVTNSVLQFFTGTGWMEPTAMYFGWYPSNANKEELLNSTEIIREDEGRAYYNFPLAFFLVGCSYFVVSLLIMVFNLHQLFKQSAVESLGRSKPYASLVLIGWDYTVQNPSTAVLKSITLAKSLKEELTSNAQREVKRSLKVEVAIFFFRMVTSIICVAATVGTIWIYMYEVLPDSSESAANMTDSCGEIVEVTEDSNSTNKTDIDVLVDELADVWSTYSASVILSLSNVIFPQFFKIMGKLEMYQFQSTRIAVTMGRSFGLKIFSICAYLYILYQATKPSGGIVEDWQTENNTLFYYCWEDYIASSLYQLCIVDFIVFCGALVFTEVVRGYLVRRFEFVRKTIGKPEFDIPKEVLNLCYKQSIFWSAYFFAPLMPVVAVIEVILIFYIKKASTLRNVMPPTRVVLTSQSTSTVNAFFLTAFLFIFIFVSLVIFKFEPTDTCGPFRSFESFTEPLSNTIKRSGDFKEEFLDNLFTNSVMITLAVAVILVTFYYRSLAGSRKVAMELLQDQIRQEKLDKRFLLARITGSEMTTTISKRSRKKSNGKMPGTLQRMRSNMHKFANVKPYDVS